MTAKTRRDARARYDQLFAGWEAEGRLTNLTNELPADADAGARLDRIIANIQSETPEIGRAHV